VSLCFGFFFVRGFVGVLSAREVGGGCKVVTKILANRLYAKLLVKH